MRLTPEQWDDAADLLDQFASQCEIAFEEHDSMSKEWVRRRIEQLILVADKRGEHPRRAAPSTRTASKEKE